MAFKVSRISERETKDTIERRNKEGYGVTKGCRQRVVAEPLLTGQGAVREQQALHLIGALLFKLLQAEA